MPEISLRAYGREIDELVERERLEEAIAHCRYILQTYPKHLETYRLLGKAYLEAKRYGDAADIFQRVLSAVPDDFVSHVGMAIVREDEGNLDAAIWHMERAFETNPSNPAIQQEMKRLISRRDGLEPHKVRLTRGALARMYAHGELFAQAIAELRSALQEDPDRPDLQVLLASMYWQTDQRSDATSVSNQILEKLPYCAEANRILAASLQTKDRIEEAAVYHRRLANLDPYAAFVESALVDANSVEDSAVQLERLDWAAGEPLPSGAPGQPGWAATLGMEMQEPAEDEPESVEPAQTGPLPSWLEPGEPPPFEAAAEKELREEMEIQTPDEFGDASGAGFLDDLEAQTADEAGGFESQPDEEFEPQFEESFKPELEDDDEGPGALGIAAAAAGIAAGYIAGEDEEEPEEQAEGAPTAEAAVAAEISDQPEDETSGEPEEVIPTEDDFGPEAEVIAEQVADGEPEEAAESEIPDWMQEAGWTESAGEVEEAPVSFSEKELDALDAGQLPEGDLEAISQAEEDVELSPAELPDWIHDIAPEDVEGSSDGAGDESIPGWIGAEASFEGEEPFEDVGPLEELLEEAAPPEGLGEDVDTDGDGEVAFPAAEPDPSELPTWITEEPPGATSTIVTWLEDQGPDSTEDEAAEVDDLPDWMRDTGPLEETLDPGIIEIEAEAPPPDEPEIAEPAGELEEVPSPEAPAGELEEVPSPEAPAGEGWLSAVAAVAAGEDSEPSGSEAELSETPDWLSEAMDSSDEPPAGGIVHGLGIAAAAAVGSDEEDEEEIASLGDDAVGGVGAEAASFEEEEIVEDEVPAEAEISEGEFPSIAEEVKLSESDADAIEQGAPDWLEEIGTLPSQPMDTDSAEWLDGLEIDGEESTAEPASETPDWLKGLAEEGADADTSGAAPAPDWLREIGEPGSISEEAEVVPESIDEEQAAPEAVGGAPDWLQGIDTPVELEQAPEGQEPEPDLAAPPIPAEEDDEVMDWLEDLAAKQAEAEDDQEVAAAAQVAAAAPVIEDREIPEEPEEGLEWLEQLADQRGMDLDVSVPSQAAPMPSEPEPEPTREPELDTTPGWIDRMATQPIPQVDLEALEAATRGEEVSPDAETIEAQASDVEAEIEEAAAEPEAMEPIPEVAPGDITIEARASDLQAAMEAAEQEAEASIPEEDEIPDWLIAAAEQTEAAAPEEPPAKIDFEPEPEIAPKLVDEPVASDEVSEVYVHEKAEAAGAVDSEQPAVEEYEFVEEPVVEETDEVEVAPEQLEPEEKVAEVESEAPRAEAKKKEDLLEQSRQALASGDPQAAIEIYGDLIKRKESLDSVIEDLRIAVDRTPENADLWQTLGDAYMRDDQTDEAIDAYRKGMEAA